MLERSYLSKSFTISDPDARLRQAENLMDFETSDGQIRKIPLGAVVWVDAIRRLQAGAKRVVLFANAVRENGEPIGWTSAKNFDGGFINETLELLKPEAGSGKFSPNAAWSDGDYIGQIDLIEIVDSKMEIERLSIDTISPYLAMVDKAASSGVTITINSGFRSYPEQKMLWDGFNKHLPGFNLAAKPGRSNHQSGKAIDIAVAGADGNEVYEWLKANAAGFGFVRTVMSEQWHWEYDPKRAQQAE
ncbi:D-alanyl-D-alanine carboxypeptidase [Achromobacter denitrificans]|nr:D-alanyl-D-alanine carboxypeptidase [Achromobacter denitrificans]